MTYGSRFSIIIPVYNCGKALIRCLESILNQPYTDYEVVVVNDGSTDQVTIEICNEYNQKYTNLILINKDNGGCVDARRAGIRASHGEYIMFGDGDDFFDKNYMDEIHNIVEHEADIYILNNFVNRIGTEEFHKEKKLKYGGYVELEWLYDSLLKVRMNAVWDKIYKRELFGVEVDIIPDNITLGEDTYINNKYLLHVNTVYVCDIAIYYHFVDSITSVCGKRVTFRNLNDAAIVFGSINGIVKSTLATVERINTFKDFYYGFFVRSIAGLKIQGVTNKEITDNVSKFEIMKNISILEGTSLKAKISRTILKYHLYTVAKIIYSK